ncbi:DapH/DapD/GlmU-related protein [Allomuricauda sp. NBRC 101325]|uniref:DapH/DapD/GlmU-related protein n=1 Tax=Allomuricauda sp. NBRC 101325 TaxID=1113758 RepID=UPI0024A3C12F|nr:DapH/DapD/GlmU-related protein [Muricauda sp. NBRC 101325]GLU45374.1 nodulation protein L [Muricauda sp. NBRC 101325]
MNIFERLTSGEEIPMNDPEYSQIGKEVNKTIALSTKLNSSENVDEIREVLGQIIGKPVDASTTLFTPFYTNYGKNISLGKNVFINHACSFLDLGGITIEDDVMIGPRVSITSENHPTEIATRKSMRPSSVVIKRNAWIGASATILPGVTVGENSVVAAGALVNKDVPANKVVGGVPAKILKHLDA